MSSPGNPFSVQTPEDIKAAEVVDLFVDVFGDFYNVPNQGHTFLHGPRGSGKSMMFRYLEPDCQLIASGKHQLSTLPFYAVYIPIKNTDLKLTELERLENKHANVVLNEHFLTVFTPLGFSRRFVIGPASTIQTEMERALSPRTLPDRLVGCCKKLVSQTYRSRCPVSH